MSKPRARRTRKVFAGIFVVLASICLLVTVLAFWGVRQVWNTDAFVGHVSAALKDPAVQASMATYISKQVDQVVQPEKLVAEHLPKAAQGLAAPIASGFDSVVTRQANKLMANEKFQNVLLRAVTKSQVAVKNLLQGKPAGNLEVNGNAVVLNTLPLIDQTIKSLETQTSLGKVLHAPPLTAPDNQPSAQAQELASKFGVTLPQNFGQVTVFRSNQLQQAQQVVKKLRRLLILLMVLTLALIAAAFIVSVRRLRTLAQLGIGVAVVMVLAWAGTRAATGIIANYPKNAQTRSAVGAVVHDFTGGLILLVGILAIVAIVAAILAFVFGSSKTAERIRLRVAGWWSHAPEAFRWTGRQIVAHLSGARVLGVIVGLLILVLVGFNWAGIIATLIVEAVWQGGVALVASRAAPERQVPAAPA